MGNRELLIGAVASVKGRVKDDGKAMVRVCDELEQYFKKDNFLSNAPFDVISLIIHYGNNTIHVSEIGKINKHSELEVSVQIAMDSLAKLDYINLEDTIRKTTLHAIIQVGQKYNLSTKTFKRILDDIS